MGKKIKYQKNAPLKEGDKVICIHMEDEFSPVAGGTPGVVKSVADVFGTKQYYVKWLSGSSLALIDGVDQWRKVVEDDETNDEQERLNEGFLFFTTKRALTKQMSK